MDDKVLNGLRYSVRVFIPALITFIGTVGMAVDYEETTLIMTLLGALSMFIGTLIGLYPAEDHNEGHPTIEDSDINIIEEHPVRKKKKKKKVE